MPIEQQFQPERAILLTRPVDPWTIEEVIEAMVERLEHDDYSPDHSILVDWRRARFPRLGELKKWATFVERNEGRLPRRRAVVLSSGFASGIAGRLAMKFLESRGLDIAVFNEMDAALSWLAP